MVPRAVPMKSGLVSLNTARQVNTAHTKTTVKVASLKLIFSKIAHSTVKRPIHKNIAFKNSNSNQRVNTVRDNNVNTARPKAVVNAARAKAVVNVGNPQQDLQEKGVIDSGCSRHMTGNMSYLTDFKEIDGGYVIFGGELHENTEVREILFLYCYAFSVSLLLTPLCCDDIHDVTPRVSALAGCDRLVSEPLVIEK
ncbi:hypothetical protein Tco_0602391 [Tanacetum coccineum]